MNIINLTYFNTKWGCLNKIQYTHFKYNSPLTDRSISVLNFLGLGVTPNTHFWSFKAILPANGLVVLSTILTIDPLIQASIAHDSAYCMLYFPPILCKSVSFHFPSFYHFCVGPSKHKEVHHACKDNEGKTGIKKNQSTKRRGASEDKIYF